MQQAESSTGAGRMNHYWPAIPDAAAARKVARQAFWGAVVICLITAVFATLALYRAREGNVTAYSYVDAAAFAVIALGIWKMSRVAAVAGLVLYLIERIVGWTGVQNLGYMFIILAFTLAFVNGVRATFAYHRFMASKMTTVDNTPVTPR